MQYWHLQVLRVGQGLKGAACKVLRVGQGCHLQISRCCVLVQGLGYKVQRVQGAAYKVLLVGVGCRLQGAVGAVGACQGGAIEQPVTLPLRRANARQGQEQHVRQQAHPH